MSNPETKPAGDQSEGDAIKRERELEEAAEALEKETGITSKILKTVAESPTLRRIFYTVAVGAGLMVGSALFEGDEDPVSEGQQYEQMDSQLEERIKESLLRLMRTLIEGGQIKDSSQEGVGYKGWYFGKMGPYDIEFNDRNQDDSLDMSGDRISIGYREGKTGYSIHARAGSLDGVGISLEDPHEAGFEAMTAKELAGRTAIIAGESNDQIVYVKFLSPTEVQKIIDGINLEATKSSLK